MTRRQALKLFEEKKVRSIWDDETQEWFFSIVDVVSVLMNSDYQSARKYWKVLKGRLKKEGSEVVTNCYQLKMVAPDGKNRLTDVANAEQLFRIIQSIPSPKAEPFKQWMAEVVATRLDQMQDPELSIEQAIQDYRRLGYSEGWEVAKSARDQLEAKLGKSVISPAKASDYRPEPPKQIEDVEPSEDN